VIVPAPPSLDALEQRDAWRALWQAATSDALAVGLGLALGAAGLAAIVLPQTPAAGVSDPIAYSQWQALAQSSAGPLYQVLNSLGLFSVAQAFWVRAFLWALAAILIIRMADRVARLAAARRAGDALQDETRLRVAEHGMPLDQMRDWLRARRYRVTAAPDGRAWLRADRAPWAELLSITLHAGTLLALGGAMANVAFGWDVSRQLVNADAPAVLRDGAASVELASADRDANRAVLRLSGGGQQVDLAVGAGATLGTIAGPAVPCCLRLELTELTGEYLVTARGPGGVPLTVTLSSYAAPATQALLTFRPGEAERSLAVEQAGLALTLSSRGDGAADRARAFAIPSGRLITDTAVRASLVISGTAFEFKPRAGAVIAAHYQPGDPLIWLGALAGLLGALGALAWPMQRIVVRRHDAWTEFYASGRRARAAVRELSATWTSKQI
jgi:hypothetical protein